MTAILVLSMAGCGNSENNICSDTADVLIEQVQDPTVSAMGGEWTILGMARSSVEVPEGYFDTYYDNVRSVVKTQKGVLDENRYSEYARVDIALAAIGKDPADVEGYDLLAPLDDYKAVTRQGFNGSAYALIAANVNDYKLKNEQKYIDHILSQELKNGGFSYDSSSEAASADMTAIAVQALAMYPDNKDAKAAADRAVDVLADIQHEDGNFADEGFDPSSESVSQVIIALTAMGVDPTSDERFVKKDKNLYDVLMDFQCDSGFCHEAGDGGNLMATEQAMCALASLSLMEEGSSLYAF